MSTILESPLIQLLLLLGPSLFSRLIKAYRYFKTSDNRKFPSENLKLASSRIRILALGVLPALTSFSLVRSLPSRRPYNVFTSNGLSVHARSMVIQSALSDQLASSAHRDGLSSDDVDLIMSKFRLNLDNRLLYIRYGHQVFTRCGGWCAPVDASGTAWDYVWSSIPDILGSWLLLVSLCSLVLAYGGAYKDGAGVSWLKWLIASFGTAGCVLEIWTRSDNAAVWRGLGRDAFQLDHHLYTLHQVLLILVPSLATLVLYLLPSRPDDSTSVDLKSLSGEAFMSANAAIGSQAYLRGARSAIQKDPLLSELANEAAEQARTSAQSIRQEPGIRTMTASMGWIEDDTPLLDQEGPTPERVFVRGGLREKARGFSQGGWRRLQSLSQE